MKLHSCHRLLEDDVMNLITEKKISASEIRNSYTHPECGGIVTFEGTVRNHHAGKSVTRLSYQAYQEMAEKVLQQLRDEIRQRWPECHIEVQHRIGDMRIGDVAVAIVAWAPHRKEAFLACEHMINRIKKTVPIWKLEHYIDGSNEWVVCCHHGE